jgi:glucosamine--fructose-6-phosphate aminotransferase (isomerizing)
MRTEALESSRVVEEQLNANKGVLREIAQALSIKDVYSLVTIARGSSDHAAHYLSFLAAVKLGKLTTSLSMSALTLYKAPLDVQRSVGIAISQSGQSPDIVDPLSFMRAEGVPTVALLNNVQSPLAQKSEWIVPLWAGPERSVAATKSFIASLAASASLVAAWKKDEAMHLALQKLPEDLKAAQELDWTKAIDSLAGAQRVMMVGRGYGLSLALEAALKLKETCLIQAEAFSAAEIKHGPQSLVEKDYPLVIFATRGPALQSILDLAKDMKNKGAKVILAAPEFVKEKDLLIQSAHSEELDVITAVQSFYLMAEELSRVRGLDPDRPRNLSKVTETR